MEQPKVLAFVRELGGALDGCLKWRCLEPITELQQQGYGSAGWDYLNNAWFAYKIIQPDAIVLQRLHWEPEQWDSGRQYIETMHRAGICVIYEIDDDLFSDDFVRRLVDTHGKDPAKAEQVRQSVLFALQASDGVTCSCQRLATLVRRHTDKPVKVVANYIDLPRFRAVQKATKRGVKGLTIGWAGGARPDSDVEQMAIAWGRIAERFPHVTFVVQGHQPRIIHEHVPDGRIVAIDWMDIETYPAGMVNIDIGCCPLADTHFNRAKTYIKAMEYAAGGSAVVASPTVYSQIIKHGHDGYICRTADEWETALAELVENANHRQHIAQRLTAKVEREHSLAANVWRWPLAWAEIIEDYRRRQERIIIPTGRDVRVYA